MDGSNSWMSGQLSSLGPLEELHHASVLTKEGVAVVQGGEVRSVLVLLNPLPVLQMTAGKRCTGGVEESS